MVKLNNLSDIKSIYENGSNNFKKSIFGIIGYEPGINDAALIEYLSLIRKKGDEALNIK